MRALRHSLLPLLLLPSMLFAGKDSLVKDEEYNFEISMPPNSIDWVKFPLSEDKSKAYVRAHFQTEYADTDPPSTCDVQLMVVALSKLWARQSLDRIAMQWQPMMEGSLSNTRDLKEGKKKIGGQEFYYRDVKGEYIAGVGHVTWYLGRMGNYLYTIHVLRTYKAVNDDMLEEEVQDIIDSFKYLKVIEVKAHKKGGSKGKPPEVGGGAAGGGATDRVDPEKIKREKVTLSHWRLELVKPKEMLNIDPHEFSKSEKANNVIAKFNRRVKQSFVEIRVYAQSAQSQKYTLDQLFKSTLDFWKKTYKEKQRLEPEIDEKYKFPMAKKAIKARLVGRRTVPETYTWIFAQCKNDRQYRISIYTTGATGEKIWKAQIDDFLKNIKPLKK